MPSGPVPRAIAAAVRMITHPRPVYAALYFVIVVLSSAALFLLLEAEFMAFALIIVYAGAILITYLFVLMLAHQAPQPGAEFGQPEYDRVPREPAAAATVASSLPSNISRQRAYSATRADDAPSVSTRMDASFGFSSSTVSQIGCASASPSRAEPWGRNEAGS